MLWSPGTKILTCVVALAKRLALGWCPAPPRSEPADPVAVGRSALRPDSTPGYIPSRARAFDISRAATPSAGLRGDGCAGGTRSAPRRGPRWRRAATRTHPRPRSWRGARRPGTGRGAFRRGVPRGLGRPRCAPSGSATGAWAPAAAGPGTRARSRSSAGSPPDPLPRRRGRTGSSSSSIQGPGMPERPLRARPLPRHLAAQPRELLDQPALILGQVARGVDRDGEEQVAPAPATQVRDPLAL